MKTQIPVQLFIVTCVGLLIKEITAAGNPKDMKIVFGDVTGIAIYTPDQTPYRHLESSEIYAVVYNPYSQLFLYANRSGLLSVTPDGSRHKLIHITGEYARRVYGIVVTGPNSYAFACDELMVMVYGQVRKVLDLNFGGFERITESAGFIYFSYAASKYWTTVGSTDVYGDSAKPFLFTTAGKVYSIGSDPQGRYIYVAIPGSVLTFDIRTGEVLTFFRHLNPNCVITDMAIKETTLYSIYYCNKLVLQKRNSETGVLMETLPATGLSITVGYFK